MARTENKFSKYVKPLKNAGISTDQILRELEEHAEKLTARGIRMQLLADDFFSGTKERLNTSNITNAVITPYHNHDFYEINYVISGECVQYIEGKGLIMKKGDLLILPPAAFHAPCPVIGSKCTNILMRADYLKIVEEHLRKCDKDNFLSFLMNNRRYMLFHDISEHKAAETADILIKELKSRFHYAPFDGIYTESLALKLIVELSACTCFGTLFSAGGYTIDKECLEMILQYIRDNISSVNLENASVHFGYTGAHLSRIIKKYTGSSFSTFVNTQRILKSKYMLTKTDIPISNIAALVGLDSKEYFCRMFKKNNGITPSEYRRTQKSTDNSEINL